MLVIFYTQNKKARFNSQFLIEGCKSFKLKKLETFFYIVQFKYINIYSDSFVNEITFSFRHSHPLSSSFNVLQNLLEMLRDVFVIS